MANSIQFGGAGELLSDFSHSAKMLRKQLLTLPLISCASTISHMTVRPGIRYKEAVGELSADMQFGPYSKSRKDTDDVKITPRELQTFFGSVVKEFDPNELITTVWGNTFTKGEELKKGDFVNQVLALLSAKLGNNLNPAIWSAKRNDSGTTTKDLFNGFDTITETEITAKTIAKDKGNLFEFTEAIDDTNAVEMLQAFYESASDELQGDAGAVPCKMFIPKSVMAAYNRNYQAVVGAIPYNKDFRHTYLECSFGQCELVPLVSKSGSKYIHLSTKQNMLIGVNQTGEEEKILVEKYAPFTLSFIATMFFGCQFESIDKRRLLVGKLFQTV